MEDVSPTQNDPLETSGEIVRRKSSRPRMKREPYISVECRHRSPKNRKKAKKLITEIKQEPEEEVILGPVTPPKSKHSPGKKSPKSPRKSERSKLSTEVKIKSEPIEELPAGSQSYPELPSISDDIALIQQSIKVEPDTQEIFTPQKKRGKRPIYSVSQENKCEYCGRMYKYRKGMLQHQRLECGQEPQFPCPYCPKKFRYRHQIRNHVFSEHNQAFKRWYSLFYTASKLPRWPEKIKSEPDDD